MKVKVLRMSLLGWALGGVLVGIPWGYWTPVPAVVSAPAPVPVEVPPAPRAVPASRAVPAAVEPSGPVYLKMLQRLRTASVGELTALTSKILYDPQLTPAARALWDRWVELAAADGYARLLTGELGGKDHWDHAAEYLGRWALVAPAVAVEKMVSIPGQREQQFACDRISAALAAARPADFFTVLAELRKGRATEAYVRSAACFLAAADPAAMQRYHADEAFMATQGKAFLTGFASGWAQVDAPAAAAYFAARPELLTRIAGAEAIATRIVATQPTLAANVLRAAPETQRTEVLERVTQAWAAANPVATLAWVSTHFPTATVALATRLTIASIPTEPAAAVAFLERYHHLLEENGAVAHWPAPTWTTDAEAGRAAAAAIPDRAVRGTVLAIFTNLLAQQNPADALAKLAPLSPQAQQTVRTTALETWAQQDQPAALAWLAAQPLGSARDAAIAGLLAHLEPLDPAVALQWAVAYANTAERIKATAAVLRRASQTEEKAVRSALKSSPLSEADKLAVLQALKFKPVEP